MFNAILGSTRAKGTYANVGSLWFYNKPPTQEIRLEDFKSLARDRLEVLREIDSLRSKGLKKEEFKKSVEKALRDKKMYIPPFRGENRDLIENDVISHFILRIAFCQTEDEKRWFIQQERDLFRIRFEYLDPERRQAFFDSFKNSVDQSLDLEEVDIQHASPSLRQDLENAFRSIPGNDSNETAPRSYYRLPFAEVIELVRHRRVFLLDGFAYVSKDQIVSKLLHMFRLSLSKGLAVARRLRPGLLQDERIGPFLEGLTSEYMGNRSEYDLQGLGTITPANIDMLSKRSFPPCMRNLHDQLRASHHLKYFGRQQYGLFLKTCGMTLDDSLVFWRSELGQKVGDDKFQKEYAYNIRHNYGKEGKRADYEAFPCHYIIERMMPSAGDHHGCPFRHWDVESLDVLLTQRCGFRRGLEFDNVIDLRRQGKPTLACKAFFAASHPDCEFAVAERVGNHPNAFYKSSAIYWKDQTSK